MNGLNRIAVLAIWLLCLFFNGAFSALVEQEQDAEGPSKSPVEMICHPGKECYPKVFVPTTTFRPVEADQVIPAGLHVRLNIGSGGREAKLIDPTEDEGTAVYVPADAAADAPSVHEYSDLVVVPDLAEEANSLNGGRGNGTEDQPPTIQVIPPAGNSRSHSPPADREVFNEAVKVVMGMDVEYHPDGLGDALERLQELSHEPEYGVTLVETVLTHLLRITCSQSYDTSQRSAAAVTLGNSLQNNAAAITHVSNMAHAHGSKEFLFKPLLDALVDEVDRTVARRIMFALSKTVRVKHGKQDFIALDGLPVLEIVYVRTQDLALRSKIAAFLHDEFLDPNMMEAEFKGGSTGDRNPQKIIQTKDDLSGWCEVVQKDLLERDSTGASGDSDHEGQVLETLKALKHKYGEKCNAKDGLKGWLAAKIEKVDEDEDWLKVPLEDLQNVFFG
ncbi:hypothetical protein ABW21_db0208604 [Orbilia brochopaga]|nr:hypothetical protein ABW21_db0208604 [Drechslerella brochopaga]